MADVNVAGQLDEIEKRIMAGLKDFQRATVNRIDELYRAGQMRVLVSDEVGLGKTLIARGTIAKLAKLQKESGDKLVKVVYVCSNASIAEQNLNKLRITSELKTESTSSSRLSMQHLNIFRQENDTELLNRYIQLIPLTPDTSFRMTSGAGTVSERALMYAILRRMPELSMYRKALEVAMVDKAVGQWDGWARDWYETQVKECDKTSGGKYLAYMLDKLSVELNMRADEDNTVLDMIISMCKQIRSNGYKQQNNNAVIGKLRVIFAKISLDKLEPDLVIMDEFQRFKYLINSDSDTETGMLANKFFNSSKVRMLLLSATPYKMYSTLEEIDETQVDEHYSEFFDVMNFLNISESEKRKFKTVWSDYSVKLKELSDGDTTVLSAKNAAEDAMYQHICRTERISASENADIIDDQDVAAPLSVMEQDIKSYVQAQKLLEDIGASFNVPVDYVKSTPYLMSFMRDYQLKRYIEKYFADHPDEVGKVNKDVKMLDAVLDMKKAVRREFVNVKHLSEQIALIDKAIDLANEDVDDLEAIRELGQGWVAEETLAIAIYCALKYSNDFDKALIASVNHSGDSDSTGAVTGNILGAYLGLSGIPEKYLKNLELKNVILELADDLFNDCKITEYGSYHDEIWEQKYIYKSYRPKR